MPDTEQEMAVGFFGDTTMQALADLSLIEDGHPTHLTTDEWSRDSKVSRPSKIDDIDKLVGSFRASLCAAVQNSSVAHANAAADALEPILYLLATYNFDAARRFAIMHFALQPIGRQRKANKFFAQSVRDDDNAINSPNLPKDDSGWKARARVAWTRLDSWHDSIKSRVKAQIEEALL